MAGLTDKDLQNLKPGFNINKDLKPGDKLKCVSAGYFVSQHLLEGHVYTFSKYSKFDNEIIIEGRGLTWLTSHFKLVDEETTPKKIWILTTNPIVFDSEDELLQYVEMFSIASEDQLYYAEINEDDCKTILPRNE